MTDTTPPVTYLDVPKTFDDRLTDEQRRACPTMAETHHHHLHGWAWDDFLAFVRYTGMFVGTMHRLHSDVYADTPTYANRRLALGYNGHTVMTTTIVILHPDGVQVPDDKPEQVSDDA